MNSSISTRCRAACLLMAVLIVALPAAAQNKGKKDKDAIRKEGAELFGPGKKSAKDKEGATPSATWSIIIEGFRGDTQDEAARVNLEKVRTQAGLKDAYLEKRGPATVIAYGSFPQGESKEARDALAKVRNTEVVIAGIKAKPFADAFLAPPAEIPGSIPEFDIRQVKKVHGDWVLYTLQIGVYTRNDKAPNAKELAEFRKTAELAVTKLRREGEQAFYYHGPTMSMVTIGLFGEEDFKPDQPGQESPALKELRKRYPHNLYNGQGTKETVTVNDPNGKQVKTTRIQPSGLVAVPKSD
jgi:hypothetical protein